MNCGFLSTESYRGEYTERSNRVRLEQPFGAMCMLTIIKKSL